MYTCTCVLSGVPCMCGDWCRGVDDMSHDPGDNLSRGYAWARYAASFFEMVRDALSYGTELRERYCTPPSHIYRTVYTVQDN